MNYYLVIVEYSHTFHRIELSYFYINRRGKPLTANNQYDNIL